MTPQQLPRVREAAACSEANARAFGLNSSWHTQHRALWPECGRDLVHAHVCQDMEVSTLDRRGKGARASTVRSAEPRYQLLEGSPAPLGRVQASGAPSS